MFKIRIKKLVFWHTFDFYTKLIYYLLTVINIYRIKSKSLKTLNSKLNIKVSKNIKYEKKSSITSTKTKIA